MYVLGDLMIKDPLGRLALANQITLLKHFKINNKFLLQHILGVAGDPAR